MKYGVKKTKDMRRVLSGGRTGYDRVTAKAASRAFRRENAALARTSSQVPYDDIPEFPAKLARIFRHSSTGGAWGRWAERRFHKYGGEPASVAKALLATLPDRTRWRLRGSIWTLTGTFTDSPQPRIMSWIVYTRQGDMLTKSRAEGPLSHAQYEELLSYIAKHKKLRPLFNQYMAWHSVTIRPLAVNETGYFRYLFIASQAYRKMPRKLSKAEQAVYGTLPLAFNWFRLFLADWAAHGIVRLNDYYRRGGYYVA